MFSIGVVKLEVSFIKVTFSIIELLIIIDLFKEILNRVLFNVRLTLELSVEFKTAALTNKIEPNNRLNSAIQPNSLFLLLSTLLPLYITSFSASFSRINQLLHL